MENSYNPWYDKDIAYYNMIVAYQPPYRSPNLV